MDGLSHLSEGTEFSVGAGAEGYAGGNVMYNHTWTFSRQTSYFSDVNSDGLPDLVRDGDVLFNHQRPRPDASSSTRTAARPRCRSSRTTSSPTSIVPTLPEVAEEQAGQFPRQDTIRRWVAPADGAIEITAPVSLAAAADSPDGVRVAIQHNATELWASDIAGGDSSEHVPTGVDDIQVDRGDRIYFRIGSKNDGAGDRVNWDPTIHYKGHVTEPRRQRQGRVQLHRFGRLHPGRPQRQHHRGALRRSDPGVSGDLVKTEADQRRHPRDPVAERDGHQGDCASAGPTEGPVQDDCDVLSSDPDTGTFPFEAEFDVTGRHANANGDVMPGDKLNLRLAVDSNVDPNAVQWTPQVRYLSAVDEDGHPLDVVDNDGDPTMVLKAPYDVDLYPNTNIALPQGTDDEDDVVLRFEVDRDDIPDISSRPR